RAQLNCALRSVPAEMPGAPPHRRRTRLPYPLRQGRLCPSWETGMIFEQLAVGGCRSYVIGCPATFAAALIDPEIQLVDHYRAIATRDGLTIRYVIDTHTHADHFSASREIGETLNIPVVMHRESMAP